MAAVEKGGVATAAAAVAAKAEEEEQYLMEGERVLDFDMLCSMVAVQAQKGGWGKLNGGGGDREEDNLVPDGGGVFRMWEGEIVYDCFDDRRLAIHSTCCPCYRFGKNMKRAGFGSSFIQGSIYLILVVVAISNVVAFIVTERRWFLYMAIAFVFLTGIYMGCCRTRIRKKFKIQGSESSFDDCVYHLICPCCTLCQESRTLEMNNVQDGIWHGRGDTICIGSVSELTPPSVVSTKSPKVITMHKTSNENFQLSTSVAADSV
ncbi:hypothetical protein ABFX02_08G144100 [Erythranthe guttata]